MTHLEGKPSADFIRQHLSDNPVKSGEDLHGELGLDATFVDEVVQCVGQRQAETRWRRFISVSRSSFPGWAAHVGILPAPTVELIVGLCGHREKCQDEPGVVR